MSNKPLAAPPDVLRWSPRSEGHGDCAVAAIELACGVTYEVALAASIDVCRGVLSDGMTIAEIKRACKSLGFTVKATRKYDLDEDTGILVVDQPHYVDAEHAVYLWEGRIIEPKSDRQQLWLHGRDFLSHYKYTAGQLLIVSREE